MKVSETIPSPDHITKSAFYFKSSDIILSHTKYPLGRVLFSYEKTVFLTLSSEGRYFRFVWLEVSGEELVNFGSVSLSLSSFYQCHTVYDHGIEQS